MSHSPKELQRLLSLSAIAIIMRLWKLTPPEQHLRIKILVMHELASVCKTACPNDFDLDWWVKRVEVGLQAGLKERARLAAAAEPQQPQHS